MTIPSHSTERDPLVINAWSGPRNISTALMYAWRQRADTVVFDEPFYGRYLQRNDPGHPARAEIIAAMHDHQDAIEAAIVAPSATGDRPVRYVKNIGHHLDVLDPSILDRFVNVLLIRNPAAVIASLTKTLGDIVTADITGVAQQLQILDHELAAGRQPIVIDSAHLLADPSSTLAEVCARLGLTYTDTMLTWPAGPKPEDGVWAPHWYHNAHASTGFAAPDTGPPPHLTERGTAVLAEIQPGYDRLAALAITSQ
ncbi:MAG: sulfotransferase family protein [Actinomycetota bacterium]